MSPLLWLALAAMLVAAELFSGSLYLLMLSLGAVAGAGLSALGAAWSAQALCAALVAALAVIGLTRWRRTNRKTVADETQQLDIGHSLHVEHWQIEPGTKPSARARFRGAEWDVELEGTDIAPQPGSYRITALKGNRLIVRAP